MLGFVQRQSCSTTRPKKSISPKSYIFHHIRLDAVCHGRLPQHDFAAAEDTEAPELDLPTGASRTLTRRQILGASGPLIALVARGLPAALMTVGSLPTAAATVEAFGPIIPSPAVEAAIKKALFRVVTKGKAALALRLVFHDAGTFSSPLGGGGLNASIQYELDRPENGGLKRGWRIVEQVRDELKGTAAEGVVTEADLVALAGAYGVQLCGGPDIRVAVGRPVASSASPDPPGRMPGEQFSAEQLKANFAAKGFSVQEMVVLSGAHTLGSKGFGEPTRFDNEYYRALLKRPWTNPNDSMASMIGLPSDHVLPDDAECLPYIQKYAEDQEAFFRDFSAAYVKLTSLGVPGWAA